jgi:hypothetical protein
MNVTRTAEGADTRVFKGSLRVSESPRFPGSRLSRRRHRRRGTGIRSYVADDPVYLKGQYSGSDTVQVADAPYVDDNCRELGYLDYSKQAQKR